jgi:hypothetical protein
MPIYQWRCACGDHEVLMREYQGDTTLTCWTCGQDLVKVPARVSIRVPGPPPLNTAENHARYQEICAETMDLGRRMAEEQGEPAGEYGCAVLPKAMGKAILAAHTTFEKGLTDDS